MNKRISHFLGFHPDFAGFIASMLCAIHCSILPVLLSFGFLSGWQWMRGEAVEWVLISFSLVIACWSLLKGYRHHHKNSALILVVIGFGLFAIGLQMEGMVERTMTSIGGLTIAISHIVNWRLSLQCNKCNH